MVLYVNRQLYTANCQTSDTSLLDTASPGHSEGVPTDNVTGIVSNNNIPGTSVQGSGTRQHTNGDLLLDVFDVVRFV